MRHGAAAALLAALVLMAGCGDDEGEADGTTRFAGDGVTVEYPADWTRGEDKEGRNGLVLRLFGESGVEGTPVRVGVYAEKRFHGSAASFGKSVAIGRPRDSGGEAVPARVIDIVAVRGDQQYRMTISGPREAVEGPAVDRIVRSWRIGVA